MNGLEKPFRKKSDPKNRKNSKNQSEIAACEQKTLPIKRIFVQTPYSHSTLKLDQISRRKTTRFFAPFPVSAWPKSLLQFDFKNHENVWTDLKKNIAGRIPETTRRRKLAILMTKQLNNYCEPWTSKKAKKN